MIPSAERSVGITQGYGTGHSVSALVMAKADRLPVRALAGDGSADIGFASARSITFGV